MGPMLKLIADFLDEDDWNYETVEDRDFHRFAFAGDNGRWTCYARAWESREQLGVYSVCPLTCPPNKLAEMSEYLHRANYGMIIGNFEMDFSDGEIRYKTSVDIENVERVTAVVKPLVYANVMMMDKYLPGIMKVISGTAPEVAIAEIEGS
ncbi:MAG: YbjN domain-containing protein [Alphaproteobacteria bacterium]|nr:YbjN domain-containing protein [Alphaproteobacteria bacterium]